jgi:hypothetical protein
MRRSVIALGVLGLLAAPGVAAQTLGTPIFMSPYRDFKSHELAGYISDPGSGVSVAVEGEYRFARPRFDFGLRAGIIDLDAPADNEVALGVDGRILVSHHSEQFPLDVSLTGGFGALFSNGNSGFLVPFGATLGRRVLLEGSKTSFTPYVHPVIAPTFGDLSGDTKFGLGLGVDVALSPAFSVRVSGAVGDYEGVGIGVAWHQ